MHGVKDCGVQVYINPLCGKQVVEMLDVAAFDAPTELLFQSLATLLFEKSVLSEPLKPTSHVPGLAPLIVNAPYTKEIAFVPSVNLI